MNSISFASVGTCMSSLFFPIFIKKKFRVNIIFYQNDFDLALLSVNAPFLILKHHALNMSLLCYKQSGHLA